MPKEIIVPASSEMFDARTNTFFSTKETIIVIEHSLLSISKWESKWHKPFLGKDQKTTEEVIDYIRCMTINKVDPKIYYSLTQQNIVDVTNYIDDPMTATWFKEDENKAPSREIVTSEVIYYWMIAAGIPFECEKWHLNRLITLIRVFNEKNKPKKKGMSSHDLASRRALNNARKKALHTTG